LERLAFELILNEVSENALDFNPDLIVLLGMNLSVSSMVSLIRRITL